MYDVFHTHAYTYSPDTSDFLWKLKFSSPIICGLKLRFFSCASFGQGITLVISLHTGMLMSRVGNNNSNPSGLQCTTAPCSEIMSQVPEKNQNGFKYYDTTEKIDVCGSLALPLFLVVFSVVVLYHLLATTILSNTVPSVIINDGWGSIILIPNSRTRMRVLPTLNWKYCCHVP